jgi:hypothetical protein
MMHRKKPGQYLASERHICRVYDCIGLSYQKEQVSSFSGHEIIWTKPHPHKSLIQLLICHELDCRTTTFQFIPVLKKSFEREFGTSGEMNSFELLQRTTKGYKKHHDKGVLGNAGVMRCRCLQPNTNKGRPLLLLRWPNLISNTFTK